MSVTPETLAGWRAVIRKEVDWVDIKPYSHNIIGCALRAIAKDHGQEEANKTIVDFKLYKKGWPDPRKKEVKP